MFPVSRLCNLSALAVVDQKHKQLKTDFQSCLLLTRRWMLTSALGLCWGPTDVRWDLVRLLHGKWVRCLWE